MFHCCFLEFLLVSLWRKFNEALMFLIRTLMIIILFKVLVSETFMFLYCVSDDSLMVLRRSIVDPAKISIQTVKMIGLFEALIFETRTFLLLLHCCFSDDSLMRHWWTMEISMQIFLISKDFIVLIFWTLRLHCCLIVYSLMCLWRILDETLMNLIQTVLINFCFRVLISGALLKISMCANPKHWCFIAAWLFIR